MRSSKAYLLILISLLAASGIAVAAASVYGDAAMIASTGAIYSALERAGQADNQALRDELYAAVLQQKHLWSALGIGGLVSTVLALLALVISWSSTK
jgi:hypothetical protein